MQKLRTFLWKSPECDGPVARMTYDPDKEEFRVYINMDYPDGINAGMISFYRDYRHLTGLNAKESMIFVRSRIFPPDRQGLQTLLKDMGLSKYCEVDILVYFHVRYTKDIIYMDEVIE